MTVQAPVRIERIGDASSSGATARRVDRSGRAAYRFAASIGWKPGGRAYGQGPPSELFVLAAFDATDQLVALAPWYLEHLGPQRRAIRFLGSGEVCSEYLTILCQAEYRHDVALALADWLCGRPEQLGRGPAAGTRSSLVASTATTPRSTRLVAPVGRPRPSRLSPQSFELLARRLAVDVGPVPGDALQVAPQTDSPLGAALLRQRPSRLASRRVAGRLEAWARPPGPAAPAAPREPGRARVVRLDAFAGFHDQTARRLLGLRRSAAGVARGRRPDRRGRIPGARRRRGLRLPVGHRADGACARAGTVDHARPRSSRRLAKAATRSTFCAATKATRPTGGPSRGRRTTCACCPTRPRAAAPQPVAGRRQHEGLDQASDSKFSATSTCQTRANRPCNQGRLCQSHPRFRTRLR